MLASEAVEKIQALIDASGDCPLYITDWNERYANDAEATDIAHDDGKIIIDAT